ncbi:MAG: ATP-binding cassette domain-containing protein, partial [Bacteroidetes bacterium]|nr:ATP-binding cassette domain-containing protein [Bacteroidota bacterium]
ITPGHFSFNTYGGRCETCYGEGRITVEMQFLADVNLECDVCHGRRFKDEILEVTYKNKNVYDILEMSVDEGIAFFQDQPKIAALLQPLSDVGIGYVKLGQSSNTLSGGEAQRVKLAAELSRPSTGKTLYILDEPTTGLHFSDIEKLLDVLHRLVDQGNTVLVVEHNLDVVKNADWVIDLGPEAGPKGGMVIAQGTPEEVVAGKWHTLEELESRPATKNHSHTATFLGPILEAGPVRNRIPSDASMPPNPETEIEAESDDSPMPWKTDGRTWHLRDRLTPDGKACRWDGAILEAIEATCAQYEELAPPKWDERHVVEFTAKGKPMSWFCHAMTGMEWLVRLVFRVGKGTFEASSLESSLGIPPLNETKGLPIYGNEPRVRVANLKTQPWQSVTILAHRLEEIKTPAFGQFMEKAVASYLRQNAILREQPEVLMPWKIMGEAWHTNAKGFPVGRSRQWDPSLVAGLLTVLKETVDGIQFDFDSRDTIHARIPGRRRIWLTIKTKDPDGLDCRFAGPKGAINLAQLGSLGATREITGDRETEEVCRLSFRKPSDLDALKFKTLFRKHGELSLD